jgi:hypothetical protein
VVRGGRGSGRPCSACDREIPRGETEYEFVVEDRTYRLHSDCFGAWDAERER